MCIIKTYFYDWMMHIMAGTANGRKSVILRIVLLVFAVYSIISLFNLQMQLIELKQELSDNIAIKEATELEIAEMVRLLDSGTEAQLIEKAARERLGYVYPEEQIHIDLSGQ